MRFPEDVYEAASAAAKNGSKSFNGFVMESVRARLKELDDHALYESFSKLGDDPEESSVEFAFEAQRQVVERGD